MAALAAFWAVLIYHLGAQWSIYDQYNYGWAVPFLCAYLVWRKLQDHRTIGPQNLVAKVPRRADVASGLETQQEADSRSPSRGREVGWTCGPVVLWSHSPLVLGSFIFCALAYAPTRWLHEANPIWRLTSWLWALEVIGLTLILFQFALNTTSAGSASTSRLVSRSFRLSAFSFSDVVFPICFFLVAVPWPSSLELFLTQLLKQLDVSAATELLGAFSIPAVQHGNVIEIRTGMVGVDDACSGIRSFQATLMISLFFGELYRLSVPRRTFLCLVGFALAFIFNIGRTFLLVSVASAKGVAAISSWHDPAGTTILLACFLCLWGLACGLQKAENSKQKPSDSDRKAITEQRKAEDAGLNMANFSIPALQRLSILLIVWILAVEFGTEFWYRSHELLPAKARQWSLGFETMGAGFVKAQIPVSVLSRFRADDSTEAHWEDDAGNAWQLFYFRWEPAHSARRRVAAQLAKTHGPATCLPAMGLALKSYLGIITVPLADSKLALEQFLFTADGQPIHVFYGIYEDPSGPSELANRRKDTRSRIAAALAGSRNYGQRFLEIAVAGPPNPETARIALYQELERLLKVERGG